ncbi:MAG: glycosyltransferase family 9 protein [Candidatus Aminicenantales bacterium]
MRYDKNIAMRILAVSGFYPPYSITGYDLGSRDIVETLKARGHEIRVLTSRYCYQDVPVEGDVFRWLQPNFRERLDWRGALLKELVNQTAFKRAVRDFSPEAALFFHPTYASASLGLLARELGVPSAYYIANFWYLVYEKDHWFRAWPKGAAGGLSLRYFSRKYRLFPPQALHFGQAMFSNRYLQALAEQVGLPADGTKVIPWGVDTGQFSPGRTAARKPRRLLYVGQVRPDKRIDTAIQAVGILVNELGRKDLSLTLVGYDPWNISPLASPQKALRALIEKCGVRKNVRLTGWKPHHEMPSIYREHDIFLYPSTDEGISSLALLEAMSSGLAIVSTQTHGHEDILEDGKNVLVFAGGDPLQCAHRVNRLFDDPALLESLKSRARETIERGFRLDNMVEDIEIVLKETVRRATSGAPLISAEKKTCLGDPNPKASLSRLAGPAKWWLRLGAVAVTARTIFRPRFFRQKGKRALYKAHSLALLTGLPFFYEVFFHLAGRRRKKSTGDALTPKNILVIQLADMGDVVLSTAFLRELRRHWPDAWIGLVVQPSMVSLVEKCPDIDEVIPFRWRSFQEWGNAFSGHWRWWFQTTILTARRLWRHNIDTAISLRWNNDAPQAAALTLMSTSGAPVRVAFRDIPRDRIPCRVTDINRLITHGPVRSYLKHEIEFQMEILSSLGATPEKPQIQVFTGPEDEDFARDVLGRAGFSAGSPIIALAPGAAWPFRRWPSDRFIALGRWLQETYGANIIILAARNEMELACRVEQGLHPGRTVSLAGKTAIRQMAAILRRCQLFIGNDSGPIHVAVGVGVPVVGFFGPGEYERFKPWGVNHEAVRLGLPCSPCSQDCAFNDPRCIRGISLNRAKEAVSRKLGSLS